MVYQVSPFNKRSFVNDCTYAVRR